MLENFKKVRIIWFLEDTILTEISTESSFVYDATITDNKT